MKFNVLIMIFILSMIGLMIVTGAAVCQICYTNGQFNMLSKLYATKEELAIYRGELASSNELSNKMIEVLTERGFKNGN